MQITLGDGKTSYILYCTVLRNHLVVKHHPVYCIEMQIYTSYLHVVTNKFHMYYCPSRTIARCTL